MSTASLFSLPLRAGNTLNGAAPRHPAGGAGLPPRDSEVGPPPSRRLAKEPGAGPPHLLQPRAHDEVVELKKQCQFLEENVKRLTHELSRHQSREPNSSNEASLRPGESFLEGTAKDDSLPPWLADPQFLSPLLVAYDQCLAEKDQLLQQSSDEVEELAAQVGALVSENEQLMLEVSRLSKLLHSKAEAQEVQLPFESQEALARIELLTAENDLLVQQQQELEKEVTRLQSSLRNTAHENSRASEELAHALSRLEGNEAALGHAERVAAEQKREFKKALNELEDLQSQVARVKAEKKLAEEQAADYRRQLDASQQRYNSEVGALQQQAAALAHREHEAASKAVAVSRDAEGHRDRMSQAAREAARAIDEAKELRHALQTLDKQLADYKERDIVAFQRIKEAQAAAEEARLGKDKLAARCSALDKEVTSLSQRLHTLRMENKAKMDAELASQKTRLDEQLAKAREEVRQAEASATDTKLSLERAHRDKRSLEAELAQLRLRPRGTDTNDVHMVQIATQVARAEEAERARDEALEKVTSLSYAAQRSMNEWERERSQLIQQAAGLGRALQKLEVEVEDKQASLSRLEQALEDLERANRALRRTASRAERRARDDLGKAKLESEAQIRALREKLDAAVQLYNRSAAEAEAIIAAKDQLLTKWKEESSQVSQSFDAASLEQRTEIGRLTARMEDLTDKLQTAQSRTAKLEDDLSTARQALKSLRPAHEAAQRRVSELSTQVSLLLASEEQLMRSKKDLRSQVERLSVERERGERQREAAVERAEELARLLQTSETAVHTAAQAAENELELQGRLLRMQEEKAELKAQLKRARGKQRRSLDPRGIETDEAARTSLVV